VALHAELGAFGPLACLGWSPHLKAIPAVCGVISASAFDIQQSHTMVDMVDMVEDWNKQTTNKQIATKDENNICCSVS
jgi:hypothetical protein